MIRKFALSAVVVAGSLACAAPAVAASGPHPAGVYPSVEAAQAACDAGKAQGRWDHCEIRNAQGEPIVLYVYND